MTVTDKDVDRSGPSPMDELSTFLTSHPGTDRWQFFIRMVEAGLDDQQIRHILRTRVSSIKVWRILLAKNCEPSTAVRRWPDSTYRDEVAARVRTLTQAPAERSQETLIDPVLHSHPAVHTARLAVLSGRDDEEISARHGLNHRQAASIRAIIRSSFRAAPETLGAYLDRLESAGVTMEEVAERAGLSIATVRAVARENGIDPLWTVTQTRQQRIRKAVELLEGGMRPAEIARVLGVTKSMIDLDLKFLGLRKTDRKAG